MAVTNQAAIEKLYLTFFNRPADFNGLNYWDAQITANGGSSAAVANAFSASAEYKALYAGLTTAATINAIYTNLFGRVAEPDAITYWGTRLDNGTFNIGTIANSIAVGAQNADITTINNKVAAATAFTNSLTTNAQILGYETTTSGQAVKDWLKAVTSDTATLTAATAALPALVTTVVNTSNANPGTLFSLTTAADAFVGGAGNDVFNAILGTGATLNTFDSITGNGGINTLNIADNAAAALGLPASVTIAGIQTINVSHNGTNNGLSVTDATFGATSGVKTFNVIDASGATAAAGVALTGVNTVSLNSSNAAYGAITISDNATAAGAVGTLNTVSVTNAGSTVGITGNALTTLNLNNVVGTTTVTAAAGTRALTVNLAGTTAAASGDVTDATATTLTINNGATGTVGTYTAAKATTVNYNATVAATQTATIAAATATALNVGGTAVASLAFNGDVALKTVTVTGTAGLTADLTTGAANVTLVDTTGTTGKASLTLNTATAYNGGAGADVITVGATTAAINLGAGVNQANVTVTALGSGGSINGGSGTTDVLALSAANAQTLSTAGAVQTAFKAAVTGFEQLTLGAIGAAADFVVDTTGFGTYHVVNVTGNAANGHSLTLNNLTSGDTINIAGANSLSSTVTGGSLGAGTSDVLNIGLSATGGIVGFGTIVTPNVETLNIKVTDTATTPVGYLNTATVTDAALHALTVSGNSGLNLGTLTGATALTSFDASGVTAIGVRVTTGALQFASTFTGSTGAGSDTINTSAALAAVTITDNATGTNAITGSSGFANTITLGNGNNTVVTGSAVDTITVGTGTNSITAGGGADIINLAATHTAVQTLVFGAGDSTLTATDKITNFNFGTSAAGSDVLNVGSTTLLTTGDLGSGFTVTGGIASKLNSSLTDFLAAATTITTAGVVAYTNGTDTYVVVSDGNATTTGDTVIQLVGVHTATALGAAAAATTIHIA